MSNFLASNTPGGEANNDDEGMRRAFEQFMLQGKSNTNTINQNYKKQKEVEDNKQKQKQINQIQQELKKGERKYWTIFHKFANILQSQWMDIDDQALQVIQSISGIRQRLPITMKILKRFEDAAITPHYDDWKYQSNHQLLTSPSFDSTNTLLQKEDVELALSHDLSQHEKMLEGLRSLFANLSEMHEALSRSLDEMMKHHLQEEERKMNYQQFYSSLSLTSYLTSASLLDLMNDLFHMLSMELFRKQTMVHYILNSTDDRVLLSSQEEKSHSLDQVELEDFGPKKIVNYCLRHWERSCDQSSIDDTLLQFAISLHEKSNGAN